MIVIDYTDRRPIYEQIVSRFKEMILAGVIKADEQLPSVRQLAMELSINPNTIQRAYSDMEREGIIYCVKGRGNFVAPTGTLLEKKKRELFENLERDVKDLQNMGVSKQEIIDRLKKI